MSKINRFGGDVKAFASEALTGERTAFGESTVTDELTGQNTAQYRRGHGVTGPNASPTLQDFNALGYTATQMAAYLHQMGVPEWDPLQEYQVNSIANVGGTLMRCLTANYINATNPAANPSNWEVAGANEFARLASANTFTAANIFTMPPTLEGVLTGRGSGGVGSNTRYGANALQNNTTGNHCTATGANALQNNTTGAACTATGVGALQNNTTGAACTATGANALQSNTTGYQCTATGVNALQNNTTGYHCTATGAFALHNNSTGYNCTATGVSALQSNTTFSNVSGFGYGSQVSGSNQVQLGDSFATTFVFGTVQNRSDLRDKADVRNTVLGLDFINALRPVDYKWDMREDYKPDRPADLPEDATDEQKTAHKVATDAWLIACKHENLTHDGTKKRNRYHHGLIAQEVKSLIDEQGIDFGGYQDHKVQGGEDVLSIGYDEMIAPLIKAVQQLSAQNAALTARVLALEAA